MLDIGLNMGSRLLNEYYVDSDNNIANVLVNNILRDMQSVMNSRQLSELNKLLNTTLLEYSLSQEAYVDVDYKELNEKLINQFNKSKRLEGLAESTLTVYNDVIGYLLRFHDKSLTQISSDDIREWFNYLLNEKGTSLRTVDNYRRYLSSVYGFLNIEGFIFNNPMKKINRIKQPKQVKLPFTSTELVNLRNHATDLRERAIFELLLSSGMRVGEVTSINYESIDFDNNCVYIVGKGNKERKVYFNESAKVAIQAYLESRTDNNPALFVNLYGPKHRLTGEGINFALKGLAKKAGVKDVHPHRFRRTMATNLLRKDVPIETIRILLGHSKLETTEMYVVSDADEIKYNHKRYVN